MSRPHVVTSSELQSLRDLELMTKATVEGLRQGLHRSPFHGYSAEFSQYRHYRPGDDLKYVDWKAFARTDRIYTRQFRETTNLSALFVIDVSRSMDFPSGRSKFAMARSIAAILGTLVLDQGDAAGVLALDDRAHFVPPRSGHHHLRVFLAEVASLAPGGSSSIAEALRRAATILKRRGMVIVISDLYDDEAAIGEARRLSRMGHDVIVVHTLSREELTLDVGGAAEFVDLESGRKLMVQPSAARESYVAAFTAWLSTVEQQLRREGIDYLRLIADEPLEPRAAAVSRQPARRVVVMSIAWIAPAALIGLALIALPIAVHLLVRQHARVLAYPSLRFLRETQLAAFRRRAIQDAALLACRVAIIAAAVTALAGPVLQTPSRTASHASRTSRAIVAIDLADRSVIAKAAEGAFASASFTRSSAADALADAVAMAESAGAINPGNRHRRRASPRLDRSKRSCGGPRRDWDSIPAHRHRIERRSHHAGVGAAKWRPDAHRSTRARRPRCDASDRQRRNGRSQ